MGSACGLVLGSGLSAVSRRSQGSENPALDLRARRTEVSCDIGQD